MGKYSQVSNKQVGWVFFLNLIMCAQGGIYYLLHENLRAGWKYYQK